MPIPILPILVVMGGSAALAAWKSAGKAEDSGETENEVTTLNSEELIQGLEGEGWVLITKRGNQHQFTHPEKPGRVTITHPFGNMPHPEHGQLMRFALVIHKDKESGYGVTVPDLPGCFSGADTLEDAPVAAREAILLHLEGMLSDGEELPHIRTIDELATDDEYSDCAWSFVDVDLASVPDKAKRVDITLPSRMLADIDRWAEREGETRSGFLAKAARRYMEASSAD